MNKNISFYLTFLCSGLLLSAPLSAVEDSNPDLGAGYIESEKWKEGDVNIPPYPVKDNLLKVEIDNRRRPYSFYIDEKTISVSDSGVIRYSILIESDSGARNVMYEGIRCAAGEYRTYAYGTSDGKFIKARTSQWQRINDGAAMAHRINFKRYYLCNEHAQPNSIAEMLQRMRYPLDFNDGGSNSDW